MRNHNAMTRRQFVSAATAGVSLLNAPVGSLLASQRRPPPNVVFILADDLGYADVACYGRPDVKTPHIDSLASEGLRMLDAYANSPVCSATRVALITGRYQYRLPVGLEEPLVSHEIGLPASHPTLPGLLKRAGYNTALVGKWHLGMLPEYGPLQSGYDRFYGFRSGGIDYYSHKGIDAQPDLWDGDALAEEQGYLTRLLGIRASEMIDALSKRGPFFLSLHFSAPHWPWQAPGDEQESKRIAGKRLASFDGGDQQTYRRMIEAMDAEVGRVLASLKRNDVDRNTLVIFTSDNGGERFSFNWPFSGQKTELLEGGIRVPALVRWPGRIAPNTTTSQVAMSMDWMPTLLAAAGATADREYPLDGIDLLRVLTGDARPVPRKVYWRYKANGQRAMRDGNMKVLKIGGNTFLFDVSTDPLERANLKARQPKVYDAMVANWNAWNAGMLPEQLSSYAHSFDASERADRYGARSSGHDVEDPDAWPQARHSAQPGESDQRSIE